MTDQEQIALAAKAAGFLCDPALTGEDGTLVGRYRTEEGGSTYVWNPKKDINDAISMACVIEIKTEYMQDRVWGHYGMHLHLSEPLTLGAVEATCAVLTRVAAEVGKQYL